MGAKGGALSRAEMEKILHEEDTGYLGLCRNNEPYALPVSYAFMNGQIIFHCGIKGLKLDIIRANPAVCFVVSRHPDRTKPHHAENGCNFQFESVQSFGKARIIEEPRERLDQLQAFKSYLYEHLGLDAGKDPVTEKDAQRTGCVAITVERMTGRKKMLKGEA